MEQLGLRFESQQLIEPTDVFGVLWVDSVDYALKHLDFRYTKLPLRMTSDGTCGRLDFSTLPDGMAFVSEWWIRAPMDIPSDAIWHTQRGAQITGAVVNGSRAYTRGENRRFWGREVPGRGNPFECAEIPSGE